MNLIQEMGRVTVDTVAISSRRYLGNKASITPWIVDTVKRHLGRRPSTFADLFAGTGSVAWAFNHPSTRIVANDLLYSNSVCLHAWLTAREVRPALLQRWMDELSCLPAEDENYVSLNFGNRYWPLDTARHIGAVRERIQDLPATPDEKNVLLASLLYAADRLANTCGHYDAFREGDGGSRPQGAPPGVSSLRSNSFSGGRRLQLRWPDLEPRANVGNVVHCADANDLAATVEAEVLYLDPPYNSRQYSDTYHVLENLARWTRPPLFGVARKMDRSHLKSRYCTTEAVAAFDDLVSKVRCSLLVVSYNNMGFKGDPRSHARIEDAALLRILQSRGAVQVEERDFKAFNAGKRPVQEHRERLFICQVN